MVHFAQKYIAFFAAIVLLHYPSIGDASSPQRGLTFAEAWSAVKNENNALQASRAEVEEAEHKQDAARDLYLPEVAIGAQYTHLDDAVELSPSDVLDSMPDGDKIESALKNIGQAVGISPGKVDSGLTSTIAKQNNITSNLQATWPIYTGGRITAAQDIAAGKIDEAQYNLQLEVISQFENLVHYYFGAVLARQVYATRIRVEDGLKEHRNHAVLLEKQGQIARVERLQAEASFDKAVVERKKAGRDLEIARAALSRVLDSPDHVDPADMLFITDHLPPLDQFISATMRNYPALGVLQSKNKQVAGLVDVEKGKYLPTVALFGNVNLYKEDDLLNDLLPDWFIGIGVNVQLLDRSGRSDQLSAARSTIKRLRFLDLQARSDLSVLVEKTYLQAEQALEEYHGLLSSLKLAQETVNLRAKAFSQGLSTSLDVVDAEMFLAGVETQRAVAAYNYIVSLGQVLAVSGDLDAFFTYQKNNGIEGP